MKIISTLFFATCLFRQDINILTIESASCSSFSSLVKKKRKIAVKESEFFSLWQKKEPSPRNIRFCGREGLNMSFGNFRATSPN